MLNRGGGARRHRALFLAGATAAGIIAAACTGAPAGGSGVIFACAAGATAGFLVSRRFRIASAGVLLSFAALGGYAAALAGSEGASSVGRLAASGGALAEGGASSFSGVVTGEVLEGAGEGWMRYVLAVRRAGGRRATGKAYLRAVNDFAAGDVVEGTGYFRLPEAAGNPGQFDYRAHLRRRGISCLATVPYEGLARAVGREKRYLPMRMVDAARRAFSRRLTELGLSEGGVIPAVLMGDRSALSADELEYFSRSGTMHVLAISGLHLGVVVGCVWWILRAAGLPIRWAAWVAMAVAAAYAVLAGGRPPVVRAAVMAWGFCVAIIITRRALSLQVISTAALVMLLFRPLGLFDAGFGMSFAAVLGLIFLGAPLAGWFGSFAGEVRTLGRWILYKVLRGLGYSLGAWAGVTPLVAYYFKGVSIVSPIANLVLLPAASVMIIAGFAATGVSLLSMKAGAVVGLSADGARMALVQATALLGRVPGGYQVTGCVGGWLVAAVYAFLLASAVRAASGRRVAPLVIAGLAAANMWLWGGIVFAGDRAVEVQTLSAFGKAAVVMTGAGGETALVIGRNADEFFARQVIVPYLVDRGLSKVDTVVETAGADVRLRDVVGRRLRLGRVLRQRRFRSDGRWDLGHAEYFGAGDEVKAWEGLVMKFHSGEALDFESPGEPYFEGLVVEATLGGRRVVAAVDMEGGSLHATNGRLGERPDLLGVMGCRGGKQMLDEWERGLSPVETVAVGDSGGATRVVLSQTPEIYVFRR